MIVYISFEIHSTLFFNVRKEKLPLVKINQIILVAVKIEPLLQIHKPSNKDKVNAKFPWGENCLRAH